MPRRDRKRYSDALADVVVLARILEEAAHEMGVKPPAPWELVTVEPGRPSIRGEHRALVERVYAQAVEHLPASPQNAECALRRAGEEGWIDAAQVFAPLLQPDASGRLRTGRVGPWRVKKLSAEQAATSVPGFSARPTAARLVGPFVALRGRDEGRGRQAEPTVLLVDDDVYRTAWAAWQAVTALLRVKGTAGTAPAHLARFGAPARCEFVVGRDGRIRRCQDPVDDALAPALDGAWADRIRRCAVCTGLFVSTRKGKEACSPRCLSTNRQRKWRKAPGGTAQYAVARAMRPAPAK